MTLFFLFLILRRWGPFLLLAGPLALGGGMVDGAEDGASLELWLRRPIVAVREAEEDDSAAFCQRIVIRGRSTA